MESDYFFALKLFLVLGPLLGFVSLELALSLRDRRRRAKGQPLLPGRFAGAAVAKARGSREVRLRK